MTDPAVEAAKVAIGDHHWWMTKLDERTIDQLSDYGIAAAREALKPIRELHRPGYGYEVPRRNGQRAETFCKHCEVKWPCDTAKLIYTIEEL